MKKILWTLPLYGLLAAASAACVNAPGTLDAQPLEGPGLGAANIEDEGAGIEDESEDIENDDDSNLAKPVSYDFEVLASTGDALPGGGQVNSYFDVNEINEDGDVIFATNLMAGGSGYYRTNDGALEMLARTGVSVTPGGPVGLGHHWLSGALNDAGDAAFTFELEGEYHSFVGGNAGVFRSDEDGVRAVMLPGVTLAPNGKPFQGVHVRTAMNKHADLVFSGIIETTEGIHLPNQPYGGMGMGIFVDRGNGGIQSVVSPGDPAPGGGKFDFAENPYINDRGDIVFGGHVAGEECLDFGVSQDVRIFCAESIYLRKKGSSNFISIAHMGDPAPGGGSFRLAFGAVINKPGDILFVGDVTPAPDVWKEIGLFLHRKGQTIAVARPGDAMPGGGNLVGVSGYATGYDLNDKGEVVFYAKLDTDTDQDGEPDTGIYRWKKGVVQLVVRSGAPLGNLGMVTSVANFWGYGVMNNNEGQIVVPIDFADGRSDLVVATSQD